MDKNILLVEYNSETIDAIKEILSNEISDISVAGDAEKAKNLLSKKEFHLVIIEALLPKSHGFILCKYVAENYPAVKIIMISQKLRGMNYHREALHNGACEFLEKPLDLLDFRHKVLQHLGIIRNGDREPLPSETTHIHVLSLLGELNARKTKKKTGENSENKIDGITIKEDNSYEIKLD